MQERLRQFEGTLNIESNGARTRILAPIPLPWAAFPQDQSNPVPLQAAV
jgi:signal transduction histidine kinase